MESQDLIKLYEEKKKQFGSEAYKHISKLLKEAKEIHKKDFLKSKTAKRAIAEGRQPDHEQSWRAFKGKGLEKLAVHIIKDEVEKLGLKVVEGNTLERTNSKNLPEELSKVKRNLLIDYGEFGAHLPDVDIIIYEPETCTIIAVISSKVTLRERIAQTGYWKIKLSQDEATKHIKVFFITPDEDKTLSIRTPAKKGRAIVEIDTDGSYIMSEEEIEESDKVKKFDKFLVDLKKLIYAKRNKK
ncbi:DNA modification methylase [Candidatus Aerophobetes bacterium]|uniref:DNA modification methylase n=1 Tax=Aerophobetes bacterium TaxID=2030807 RepID=A0A662D4P2_UNCAE|nr:MAG: DNA modification methylase [Candidatus Aerophobetes bacterium]